MLHLPWKLWIWFRVYIWHPLLSSNKTVKISHFLPLIFVVYNLYCGWLPWVSHYLSFSTFIFIQKHLLVSISLLLNEAGKRAQFLCIGELPLRSILFYHSFLTWQQNTPNPLQIQSVTAVGCRATNSSSENGQKHVNIACGQCIEMFTAKFLIIKPTRCTNFSNLFLK